MDRLKARNWFGDITSSPRVVTHPRNVEEIIGVLQDTERYPSPVRAAGSNHSTTPCATADGGTVAVMRNMDRILHIGPDTVTTEAGALYINVAQELRKYGLQFYVNVEIGNLTMGAAACSATKESSLAGEYGQVASYATRIKLVTPSGEDVEVTEEQPELLQAVRSSHGLFGIAYEVTFKVKPVQPLAVYHKTYTLDSFARALPALRQSGESIMMFISPLEDVITIEFRRYRRNADPAKASSWQWKVRNLTWEILAPYTAYLVSNYVPARGVRDFLIRGYSRLVHTLLAAFVRGRNTHASDQMIRYAETGARGGYTFSIWGFPEEEYVQTLRDYFAFCQEYYRSTGYRTDLLDVSYRVAHDTSSLLSYSWNGTVMTIDPVSTANPGWEEFIVAYNEFCSRHNGVPLFNQSNSLTRAQVEKAFGDRLHTFQEYRRRFDPADRLLNQYFKELLV